MFFLHRLVHPLIFLLPAMVKYIKSFLDPIENGKQYEVMIGDFLACNYMDFVSMMTSSLGSCEK